MPKPPRKSNVSIAPATGDEGTPSKEKEREKEKDGISIEDLSLPRTMVQRLAKGVLPPNTQIQKDAITAMSKGATVFVNYLSNAANLHTHASGKRTITPGDVLLAMGELEFDGFTPRLEAELAKFNQVQTGKRNEYRRKVRESGTGGPKSGGAGGGAEPGGSGGEEGGRARTRVRRGEGPGAVLNGVGGKGAEGAPGADVMVDEEEGEGEGEPEGEAGDDVGEEEEEEEEEEEGSGEEGEEGEEEGDVDVVDRDEEASDEALDDAEDSD